MVLRGQRIRFVYKDGSFLCRTTVLIKINTWTGIETRRSGQETTFDNITTPFRIYLNVNLKEVVAIHAAATVKGAAGGHGTTTWHLGLPRSRLAFAGRSSAGLMLGDFARLQEALHARRLFDGLCEDCLIATR